MKNVINFFKKNKIIISYIFLLIIFAFGLLLGSPLNPFAKSTAAVDSSVFMYMAKGIERGLVPYRDLFDHKGLLIYFIDLFGFLISNGSRVGIWLLEIVALLVDFYIIWKITSEFTKNKSVKFWTIIFIHLPFLIYYGGGNRVEEFALPFIYLILLMCIKYLKNNYKNVNLLYFIIGLATGMILWLKPNMIIIDVAFALIVLIKCIIDKKFKELFKYALFIILGIFVVSIPFVIYLLINHAVTDAIECYLLFNFEYTGDSGSIFNIIGAAIESWKATYLSTFSLIVLIIGLIKSSKYSKNYWIYIGSIVFLILGFIICSMSGRFYVYNALICLPSFVIPVCIFLDKLLNNIDKDFIKKIVVLGCLALLLSNNIIDSMKLIYSINTGSVRKSLTIANYIKENTNEDDEVVAIGNKAMLNIYSDRYNSAKYFFQVPVADINNDFSIEFMEWIKETNPKIIVDYLDDDSKEISEYRKSIFEYLDYVVKTKKYKRNDSFSDKYVIYERCD